MGKKCVVCQIKQSARYERSFHTFPNDEEKRKKWTESLHLKSNINFKTALVCGIHFDESSFLWLVDERQRKKLRPDAVPRLGTINKVNDARNDTIINLNNATLHDDSSLLTSNTAAESGTENENLNSCEVNINIVEESSNKSSHGCGKNTTIKSPDKNLVNDTRNNTIINSNDATLHDDSSLLTSNTAAESGTENENLNSCEVNINIVEESSNKSSHGYGKNTTIKSPDKNLPIMSKKRKSDCVITEVGANKRFKFYKNNKTYYLSKDDFKSEEAWATFQQYQQLVKNKLTAMRVSNHCYKKRFSNLQDVIEHLKTGK